MSDAQRQEKGNMQTHENDNAREEIAALKQQLLESQKRAEYLENKWNDSINNLANFRSEYSALYSTHKKYTTATKAQITSLTKKLRETETKLKELQNLYFGANNSDNTTNLITKLVESEKKIKELEANKTILENNINDWKEEHHTLAKQFHTTKMVSESTINDLKEQLEEARLPQNLQKQSSQPAAELSAEPSRQATKASQTDFRSAKEADLELKCGKQQVQIQQLQQQLQESQRQLEEQAVQHRQEREKFQSEMNEVKSLLTNYKNLHAFYLKVMKEEKEEKSSMGTQLEKAEAEKELLPQTVEPLLKKEDMEQGKEGKVDLVPQTSLSLQEPAEEKQGTEQGKEGKVDSLLETVRSLQETLKTKQGNENILITKLEKLEAQPKQKKKKRNWLLRLFSRNKS